MPKWQWVYTCRREAYIAFMQTQLEMTRSAVTALEQADRNLNTTYKQLQGKLDKQSRAKLLIAQRAWLAYRDADALLKGDIDARGGSMQGMLVALRKRELTISRTADFKRMIEHIAGR
jgi:uncharacterized protein YecT (DUF1311 family)